jgi:hypothetical protein
LMLSWVHPEWLLWYVPVACDNRANVVCS